MSFEQFGEPVAVQQQHEGQQRTRRALLNHAAALGLLVEAPCHGYLLFRRFQDWRGEAAPHRPQAIYEILDVLRADGHIEPETGGAGDRERQRRTRYLVTPSGRDLLVRWVASGFGKPETTDEFLLRLRCAGALRDFDGLERALGQLADDLLRRQQELPPPRTDVPTEPKLLLDRIMRHRAEAELAALVGWVEWAQAMLLLSARGAGRVTGGPR